MNNVQTVNAFITSKVPTTNLHTKQRPIVIDLCSCYIDSSKPDNSYLIKFWRGSRKMHKNGKSLIGKINTFLRVAFYAALNNLRRLCVQYYV